MGWVWLNPVDIFEKNVIPIVRNISINKNIIPVSKYIYNILENDKTSELKIKKIHSLNCPLKSRVKIKNTLLFLHYKN